MLGAVVAAALGSRARPVLVVTGHAREAVEAVLPQGAGVSVVHNPGHAEGEMASSIKIGLAWLGEHAPETKGALIILGDLPLLSATMLDAVVVRTEAGDARIIAPRYQGQRGHPVWLAREVWDEAMALKPGAQLRELLRARPDEVLLFDVDDPAILMDVDTPEQMREAKTARESGHRSRT